MTLDAGTSQGIDTGTSHRVDSGTTCPTIGVGSGCACRRCGEIDGDGGICNPDGRGGTLPGPYTTTCVFKPNAASLGATRTVTPTTICNLTVEGLPDATFVGTCSSFTTDNPSATCLNGSSLNVWVAPNEYGSLLVIHNGNQGPQCTYGCWSFAR